MAHLIDKDALVARIENLENTYKKCPTRNSYEEGLKEGRLIGYKDALHKINTIEVKEVDLDFMLHEYWGVFPKICVDCLESATMTKDEMIDFAKHFFELGVRVNNPITAADRGTAEEIIINLKRVEQDYHIDLTREIEWLSNKVQRGE